MLGFPDAGGLGNPAKVETWTFDLSFLVLRYHPILFGVMIHTPLRESPGVWQMVMRNRHDGANTPNWWDDLPPGLRKRFELSIQPEPPREETHSIPEPTRHQSSVIRDLSRLVAFFLLIAIANLLFLLLALTYLFGNGPFNR